MAFGLDSTGLTIRRLADTLTKLRADVRGQIGAGANTSSNGLLGIIIGIIGAAIDEVWQSLQQLYDSLVPQNAIGVQLTNLAEIKGLYRLPATKSTSPVTLTAVAGTVVPAGTQFSVGTGGDVYVLDAAVDVDVSPIGAVTALEFGFRQAAAGAIDTIKTPVVGLTAVTNASDATPGQDVESDMQLRLRVARAGQILGRTPRGSVESRALQEIENILDAVVIENNTYFTVDGRPPKSLELVLAGTYDTDEVAQFLFENVAGGIETVGLISALVTDSRGYTQTFKWNDATDIDTEYSAVIVTDNAYPADGDAQVLAAIVAHVGLLRIGAKVDHLDLVVAIHAVGGVDDLTLTMGLLGGGLTAVDIPIADDERAVIDDSTTDIAVSSS